MPGTNHQSNHKFSLSNIRGIIAFKRRQRAATQTPNRSASASPVQWEQTFWGRKFMKSATLVLALFCSASVALADIKITTRSSAGSQTFTQTTYIKGARQRTEGMGYTTIYQCDLKRTIQINDKTRTYVITPHAAKSGAAAGANSHKSGAQATKRGGVITYTTTTTDTGERKEMFGLTARHLKTKTVVEASEGACNSMNMEMESEGWYADLPGGLNCQTEELAASAYDQSECVDEIRFKTVGTTKPGQPLMVTTRMKLNMGEGAPAMPASTQEVVDFSTVKLDAALFEIPAGYKEVKSMQELGSPF